MLDKFKIAMTATESTKFLMPLVPGLQVKSSGDDEMKRWEETVATIRAATVHILVFRNADRHNAILQATPEQNTTYDDRSCLACFGTGVLRCQNRECKQGTVITFKEVIVPAPNNNTIRGVKRFVSKCSACDGDGYVRCEYCQNGIDPWFSR